MSISADTLYEFTDFDPDHYHITNDQQPSRKAIVQKVIAGTALAWVTMACGWTLSSHLMAPAVDLAETAESIVMKQAPARREARAQAAQGPQAAREQQGAEDGLAFNQNLADLYAEIFDSSLSLGYPAGTFVAEEKADFAQRFAGTTTTTATSVETTPVVPVSPPASRQLAQTVTSPVPLPVARPIVRNTEVAVSTAREAQGNIKTALATPAEEPTLLQKLFGKPRLFGHDGPTLAYAPADGGLSGATTKNLGNVDQYTAVYDISAKTVYMPDGSRLEAHSGLGDKMDDPGQVHLRMRGATPPHTYDLSLRESLFHGVQAIRLKPVGGEDAIFGRTGLLAHTYMLGPNGQSNGCVSFKDYNAFLRAYQEQKVKRLVVVARL